jgi:crotonobetainyl-CoA:carnitine CoA-transferase CaiB-like acyl-CoA transferase
VKPLESLRVLELAGEIGDTGARLLADLGARVVKVELPGGAAGRRTPMSGISRWAWLFNNANKLGVSLDPRTPEGSAALQSLIDGADIVIDCWGPGRLEAVGLAPEQVSSGTRVLVRVSDFGQTGPYRNYVATETVLYAMSGQLSRSGFPGAEPLLPPAGIGEGHVGAHIAWAALLAHYKARRTAQAEIADLSAFEAITHTFDPVFGTQGSAAAARPDSYPRDRPESRNFYPVYRCKDGYVRVCILSSRQWKAMFEWLGSPEAFAGPGFNTIPGRYKAADRLNVVIQQHFDAFTRDELVTEGAARGIPIGEQLDISEVLRAEHFDASGTLADLEIAPGFTARVPAGQVRINGERAGFRHRAPLVGEHNVEVLTGTYWLPRALTTGPALEAGLGPLQGIRILDLGGNVFGAEISRQFADNGADVIRVENSGFPDGLRQSRREGALPASYAWGNRNKRSLGLDLRSPSGINLFLELAGHADVVLANFKGDTLAKLGITYEALSAVNPTIVLCDSSAFGNLGPWRTRMGYGPLVRASCGLSALWSYPNTVNSSVDGSTVYPDHAAGQTGAVSVLACLVGRLQSGRGAHVEMAQADVALSHIAGYLAIESLLPGYVSPAGNPAIAHAPSGVFPCPGDDEWCVVAIRDDEDWKKLCAVVGRPDLVDHPTLGHAAGRLENRAASVGILTQWLSRHRDRHEPLRALQEAGIPAGPMMRGPELLTDAQLIARGAYAELVHPQLPMVLHANLHVASYSSIPLPSLRPSPDIGEHTRAVVSELLGMGAEEIDKLVAGGVLEEASGCKARP